MALSNDYKATVVESGKDLTAIEKIKLADMTDATNIQNYIDSEPDGVLTITIDYTATVEIHNSKSSTTDYHVYVFVTPDGEKYYTGSDSVAEKVDNIASELRENGMNLSDVQIKFYGRPSKNYTGRNFLTASIA